MEWYGYVENDFDNVEPHTFQETIPGYTHVMGHAKVPAYYPIPANNFAMHWDTNISIMWLLTQQ